MKYRTHIFTNPTYETAQSEKKRSINELATYLASFHY